MKLFGIVCAALISVSSALPLADPSTLPFYITAPLNGTVYRTGTSAITKWRNGLDGPFKIYVLQGSNPELMQNTGVELTANGKAGDYSWTVPESFTEGTYAFQYVYNIGGVSGESFSPQFQISAASV
ncbi:uncharacterized protein BX663DRAFT_525491 [Cokeromyces recurvatus]|uniref:uncharacterized protein n=1 Tax=Cokeromyces recurvatus TaxID=90255 RepID=UPI00222113C0|nr:uncharacterized protein BX663DRAFT_525491 [Cokeromyces recurvatus]KAI7898341.1 hypothetical protein BX663DRAFT_525491 [Cokeromyces recurvatus]